jgi:hypothetical protein
MTRLFLLLMLFARLPLLLPVASLAAVYDPILEQVTPRSITIIGESHKRPESIDMFRSLALAVAGRHRCVVVGLEIASDQQAILDAVMQGRASVNDVALWPPIAHPPYRRMLENFAALKQQGLCIEVAAIDADMDNKVDRDQWMALRLAEQVGDAPVLVLLGALHTLKKIDWLTVASKPRVAEILNDKGFRVRSFPQRWIPEQCSDNNGRMSRFASADSPEALTILNDSLVSLLNARPYESIRGVVDGFILWECGNEELGNDSKLTL